jgi:DNA polymerase-3 subunit epsilon
VGYLLLALFFFLERHPTSGQPIKLLAKITGVNPSLRSLDDWLGFFGIECAVRHQAAADTFATAELLMRLWPYLMKEASSWASLRSVARQASWIPR